MATVSSACFRSAGDCHTPVCRSIRYALIPEFRQFVFNTKFSSFFSPAPKSSSFRGLRDRHDDIMSSTLFFSHEVSEDLSFDHTSEDPFGICSCPSFSGADSQVQDTSSQSVSAYKLVPGRLWALSWQSHGITLIRPLEELLH